MNVKQASAKLGKSQSWLVTRLRRLKVNKLKGTYYLTENDLDMVEALPGKKRHSVLREIASDVKLSKATIRRIVFKCDLRFRNGKDKIIHACKLYKTGHYTLKGIKHFIHEK